MTTQLRRQRGITLVESLIGFLVLSMGVLGATHLQSWLRLNGDIARQRTDAVRYAQQDMEQVRAFANAATFDSIAARQSTEKDRPVPLNLTRNVATAPKLSLKTSTVSVSWLDRSGARQAIQLQSLLAGVSPIYSAALTLPPQDTAMAPRRKLPRGSTMIGNGRSVFKPSAQSTVAWVINSTTGWVTEQCSVSTTKAPRDITDADLTQCSAVGGRLLGGFIRFSLSAVPDAVHANDSPLPLSVDLSLDSARSEQPRCEVASEESTPDSEPYLAYTCLVPQSASANGWSGQLRVVPTGWALGATASTYKVCRYSTDHPERYVEVHTNLAHQNYLVIRGDAACPEALPQHNEASVATAQYQP
ncbi:MAG: prepilin-type N-terminal cleavage/methylation domain-containing protein [Rhizobacter sp.]